MITILLIAIAIYIITKLVIILLSNYGKIENWIIKICALAAIFFILFFVFKLYLFNKNISSEVKTIEDIFRNLQYAFKMW
jgi:predicted PurR-regulated permease PerM